MSTLGWIVASGVAMSAIALVGVVTTVLPAERLQRVLLPLVAFAAGTLLGGAFLHMLPAAIASGAPSDDVFLWTLAGFAVFFGLEQFLHWRHSHRPVADGDKRPLTYLVLIADGLHVHPALVDLVWRVLGPDRLNLVTDAMAAMGMEPGEYRLGDYRVRVDEESARLPDGTLAGCTLSLDAILRAFMAFTGAPLPDALATVTTTPARLLGLDGRLGRIAPGLAADLVLMTPELAIVETLVAGETAYRGS